MLDKLTGDELKVHCTDEERVLNIFPPGEILNSVEVVFPVLDEPANGEVEEEDEDTWGAVEEIVVPDRIELDETVEVKKLLELDVMDVLEGAARPEEVVAVLEPEEATEELDWAVLVRRDEVEVASVLVEEDDEVDGGGGGGGEGAHPLRIFFMYRVKSMPSITFFSAAVASHSITPPKVSGYRPIYSSTRGLT